MNTEKERKTGLLRARLVRAWGVCAALLLCFGEGFRGVAQPVFLTSLSDLTVKENFTGTNLAIRIWSTNGAASSLSLAVSSTNATLVPDSSLKLSGSSSNRTLRVIPATNQFGSSQIQLVLSDTQGGSASNSFVLTVLPVNHAPALTLSTNRVAVLEDAGLVTMPNLVASRSSGPPSESSQSNWLTLYYTNSFFAQPPAIDDAGTLTFQVASNGFGSTSIKLVLQDDGGTANGGKDSSTNTLNLTVTPVNDPPYFSLSTNLVVAKENAGAITLTGFLTGLKGGPPNESSQTWNFTVLCSTNDPTNVPFAKYPALSMVKGTNATLTFRTATNCFGTNTVTIIMTDNGGTANGGVNSYTNQFVLGTYWVNQPPRILGATNCSVLEQGSRSQSISVIDVDTAGTNLTLSASTTNTSLVDVSVTGPGVVGATNATYSVNLVPKTNCAGTATIMVVAGDGMAQVTNRFALTVTAVNQAPSFAMSTNLVLAGENCATVNVTNFLTGLTAGPRNESSQTWSFKVYCPTNDPTNAHFGVFPSLKTVKTNATLSFRPGTNSFGTNTVTIVMTDSGGTNHGGVNSFTNSFQLGLYAINQAPYIVGATNRSIRENESLNTTASISVYDVDGPGSGLTLTASTTNSLLGVSVSGPVQVGSSNATFTLTFAPVTNLNGNASIKLVASDGQASRTNSFTLTVLPVNQPPGFTFSSNVVVAGENAGAVTISNFLTGLSAGPANESAQTWSFSLKTVTNQSTNVTFLNYPAIQTVGRNGTLTFKTATNSFGTNAITVIMTDSGGVANGGVSACTNVFQLQVPWSNQPPFISWITNRVINENQTTNLTTTVAVYDSDSAVSNLSLTASSSNTALADVSVTATRVANGTNLLCDLTFAPKANANGALTIWLAATDGVGSRTNSFKLTINAVDQAPTFVLSTNLLVVPESCGLIKLTNLITGVSPGPSNELSQTLNFTVYAATNQPTNVMFTTFPTVKTNSAVGGYTNAILTFQPVTNTYGTNLVWVVLTDSGYPTNGGCNTYSNWFNLAVVKTNQAPFITGATNRVWLENSTSNGTAVISLYDIDSPGSALSLSASSSDSATVAVSVAGTNAVGSTNADFLLSFTQGVNLAGKVVITLVGSDGICQRTNSFTITINRVNQAPSFDFGTNRVRLPWNYGPVCLTNFVTNCVAGPTNESDQRWTFNVLTATNDATNVLFKTYPALGTNNAMAFETQTNCYGTNSVTILMTDNGGTANGGANVYSNSFQLEIYWAQIPPVIQGATNFGYAENSTSNLSMNLDVSSVVVGVGDLTVSAQCSDLSLADVTLSGPNPITPTDASYTLTFLPVADAYGSATITLVADDGVSRVTNSFILTVGGVNEPPYFDLATNELSVDEYAGALSFSGFLENLSVGPPNESGQTWAVSIINIAPGPTNVLFSSPLTVTTNGTLSFCTRADSFGTNSYAVIMKDSGGTNNGGVDSFTNFFVLEVADVSQLASFRMAAKVAGSYVPSSAFVALQGSYAGLFFETNALANDSSGYFELVLEGSGLFSGYALSGGRSNRFGGRFEAGSPSVRVPLPGFGLMNLRLADNVDMAGSMSGSVEGWDGSIATLIGFQKASNAPAEQSGQFRLTLSGNAASAPGPSGDSLLNLSLSVSREGEVSISGALSDESRVDQQGQLAQGGHFPLYAPFGSGGSLSGWITGTSDPAAPWQGSLLWIQTGTQGEGGFSNLLQVLGSRSAEVAPAEK